MLPDLALGAAFLQCTSGCAWPIMNDGVSGNTALDRFLLRDCAIGSKRPQSETGWEIFIRRAKNIDVPIPRSIIIVPGHSSHNARRKLSPTHFI